MERNCARVSGYHHHTVKIRRKTTTRWPQCTIVTSRRTTSASAPATPYRIPSISISSVSTRRTEYT
jgi:hypothetical protein